MVPHLFALHPDGTKRAFFLCAPAGGVLFPCYHLLKYWENDRPFYGIQDPSLNKTTPIFRTVEDLARGNIDVMKAQQPRGPYIIGGWSFGAMVALEMARQLGRSGEQTELIVLGMRVNGPGRESPIANLTPIRNASSSRSSSSPCSATPALHARRFYVMFGDRIRRGSPLAPILRVLMFARPRAHRRRDRSAPAPRRHRDAGTIPLPARAQRDMRAFGRYKPQPLHAHGSLIKASDSASLGLRSRSVWASAVTLDGLDIHDTPGNHVTLMLHPAIEVVAPAAPSTRNRRPQSERTD